MSNDRRCRARTPRGRCKVTNQLSLEGLCIWHDEHRKNRATAIRRKGAKAGGKARWERVRPPPPPTTLDEAIAYASWVTHAVACGDLDPRRAAEITRGLGQFTRALKERDVAQRMAAIEAQLKALKTGHGDAEQPAKAPRRAQQR